MKIILLGADGQVGWELQRSLSVYGKLKICGRQYDFENHEILVETIKKYKPDVIVNAAAYTDVDKAEDNQTRAYLINTKAVEILSNEAKKYNAWFVHYSTDYVYDGKKKNFYEEEDQTNPLNVYGASKLAGEKAIELSGCRYLIFRTSWVFGVKGNNFIKKIICLAKEKKTLSVISDQFGVPTSAEFLADVTALCISKILKSEDCWKDLKGIYHLVPLGETTWYDYSKFIVKEARSQGANLLLKPENIIPISTEQYLLPAKRPKNSMLNTDKIQKKFDIFNLNWEFYVKRMIKELVCHKI